MESFITSTPGIIAMITALVAASLYLYQLKWLSSLGPALICILLGMFLSNTGITPFQHPVYDLAAGQLINLSIAIMLLGTDLKNIISLSSKPILAVISAFVSVMVATFVFGVFFAPNIDEGWKLAGMFVGTYTGGGPNLNAIGSALNVSPKMLGAANTADYIVYTPFLISMMYLGNNLRNMKWFAKIWPYKLEQSQLDISDGEEFLNNSKWTIKDIAWIIAIGYIIVWISSHLAGLAGFTAEELTGTLDMVILTTVSLICAQLKPIKKLRGKIDIGMYISLFFLAFVGLSINLREFFTSAPLVGIYCFLIVFCSLALHVMLCRLFKIEYQIVMVSMQAAIGSDASAPILALSSGWKSLVGVAVILGILGNATGNYLGLALAYALKSMMGL